MLSAKVPVGDGWIHGLKHDGFRIVALKDGDDVRLWSRNGRNWAAEMVAIAAAVLALHGREDRPSADRFCVEWIRNSRFRCISDSQSGLNRSPARIGRACKIDLRERVVGGGGA